MTTHLRRTSHEYLRCLEDKQGKREGKGGVAAASKISAAGKKSLGESVSGWEIDGPLEGHGDHEVIPRSPRRCAGP